MSATTPRLPRLTVSLDHDMARAVAAEAAAQGTTMADVVRSGIDLELRVRRTAATVIADEVYRRGEAARRLAEAIARLSGGARPVPTTEIARAATLPVQEDQP